jgi:uncharacterized protein YigE (DUF2233 family)
MVLLQRTFTLVFLVLTLGIGIVSAASGYEAPCHVRSFEGDAFAVCTLDTREAELRLVLTDRQNMPLRSFSRRSALLGADRERVLFAMNAGMFDQTGRPIGLYVERGSLRRRLNTESGAGNFYLKPNGVFWLEDGVLHLTTTGAFAGRHPDFATQSGPMLVINGSLHPQLASDGPSKNVRNGVGVIDTHTAVFVISESPVSFGRFARLFRDALGCRNALYLDGTISSAWMPSLDRQDHSSNLGPMVVVLKKPDKP